ncbi:MAG: CC0125/CC1285 family lipoprotein [Cellvibrionaceae bacterium]
MQKLHTVTTAILKLSFLLLAVTLVACSSRPVYSPAEKSGNVGFYESKLTDDRYRVTFIGYPSTSGDDVQNYVLLRAAELTLQNNFDWFKVINRTTTEKSQYSEPTWTIGLSSGCYPFGCRAIGSRWYSGLRVNSENYSDRYKASIEILMGKEKPADPSKVYDARELEKNLRKTIVNPRETQE